MALTQVPAASTSKVYTVSEFTSSGSLTLPSSTDGFIDIAMIGGGGGGGGGSTTGNNRGGGGGGSGQFLFQQRIPCAAGTVLTVTVGTGGTGNTRGVQGGAGGDSTINISSYSGTIITAKGGNGGGSQYDSGDQLTNFAKNGYGASFNWFNSGETSNKGNILRLMPDGISWAFAADGSNNGSGNQAESSGYPYGEKGFVAPFESAGSGLNFGIEQLTGIFPLIPLSLFHSATGGTGGTGTGGSGLAGSSCLATSGFGGAGVSGHGLGSGPAVRTGGGAGGGGGFTNGGTPGNGGNAGANSGAGGGGGGASYASAPTGTSSGVNGGAGFVVIGYFA